MALIKRYTLLIGLLLYSFFLKAQIDIDALNKSYDQFQTRKRATKIQLVFNQEKFYPGEIAFFKAYFLYNDLTLIKGKQLINFSLIDSKGTSIIDFKMNVEDGIGFNQFTLPENLPAGYYLATARSDWMKNFEVDYSAKKQIEVVRKNKIEKVEATNIEIYPEGGNLIFDQTNKVTVATNRPNVELKLIENEDVVDRIQTNNNGFASFDLKPNNNSSYSIQFEDVKAKFPNAKYDGIGLNLSATGKIHLYTAPKSQLTNELFYLAVSSKGKLIQTEEINFDSDGKTTVQILKTSLPNGVAQISILNQKGDLMASRSCYIVKKETIVASIEANPARFETRQKVNLKIDLTDESKGIEGEFSIKVLNSPLFGTSIPTGISDEIELYYNSQVRLKIDGSIQDSINAIDQFLISKNEVEPWKEILSENQNRPDYSLSTLIQKTGRASDKEKNSPLPDGTQIIFFLQKDETFYQSITSSNGLFTLNILDIYVDDELFYTAESPDGKAIENLSIEWLKNENSTVQKATSAKEIIQVDPYADYANKVKLIEKSYSIFTSEIAEEATNDSNGISTFEKSYFEADDLIKFEEYKIFPTMTELIKEVINPLRTVTYEGEKQVKIKSLNKSVATGQPVYIIDGIATKNTEFFLALKTNDLVSMKIFRNSKKLARLGFIGKNGIVMVQTKSGNSREKLDTNNLIQGLNKPLNFEIRKKNPSNTNPDFRSTVYWNPSVRTDFNGKTIIEFYTTDDTSPLLIQIDGFTSERIPFTAFKTIEFGKNN